MAERIVTHTLSGIMSLIIMSGIALITAIGVGY